MDTALLLEQFGHLTESLEGIQKLRNLILGLAARGKLVPQDLNEESVNKLLKQIEEEKKRLIKTREIRSSKPLPPMKANEFWLDIPASWSWIRLSDIGFFTGGGTPSTSRQDYWNGNVIWVSPKDMKSIYVDSSELTITEKAIENSSAKLIPKNSLLIVARSGILKRLLPVAINTKECTVNQDIKVLVPYDEGIVEYLRIMLKGFERYILENLVKTGMTVQSLKYEEFASHPFPLPPLAEQQRIVARVDELMRLCDQLEDELQRRTKLHEYATKSTLHHLVNASSKSETLGYWERVEQHFNQLFERDSTIEELKGTILLLAVQGLLVPQDPNDEPASELLKRILSERHQKWNAHKLSEFEENGQTPPNGWEKRYQEPDSPDVTLLPTLPNNWIWINLGQIAWLVKDGPHYSPKYTDSGIPFITGGNVRPDGVDFEKVKYISPELHKELSKRCKPELGDILYTKGGTTGIARVNTYDIEFSVWVHVAVLKLVKSMNPFYVQLALNSPFCYEQSQILTHGIGNKDLGLTRMINIIMPLPPIDMQERILTKVDELMQLCEQLDEEATTSHELSAKLLDSIIYHLFEPLGETEKVEI